MKNWKSLLTLCEDIQELAYMREVSENYGDLTFSCDLLLRNMIMIINLESKGENIGNEYRYLKNNLISAFSRLTGEKVDSILEKYELTLY